MKALKPIYTAPTVDAAAQALDKFEAGWGHTYGAIVELWRRHWERFIPVLDFDPAIRKIVCTTNAIILELPTAQGHQDPRVVPTDDAVVKIFY